LTERWNSLSRQDNHSLGHIPAATQLVL